MNRKLLLISISLVTLCSCSSVYKSGQTPDDVYFSPIRTGYDEARKEDDKKSDDTDRYQTIEDRQIRMGINNRRWRTLDNYDYSYNPYYYGYNYSYYYNPFYCHTPVYNPVVVVVNNPKNTTPRKVNLGGYNSGYNNTNTAVIPKNSGTKYNSRPANTYNNSNSGLGKILGKVLSPGSSSNNSNSSSNSSSNNSTNRSYTPSSSSGSSSGGSKSSSSGGSVSRPARNGKG